MLINCFRSVIKKSSSISYIFPSLRLVRIAQGSVEWMVGEKVYPCQTGDVILLNNLTARKMISLISPELYYDVFEFFPIEIRNHPKLISLFYSKNTIIVPNADAGLLNQLLDSLALCAKTTQNDDLCFHQLQSVFSLLEELFPDVGTPTGNSIAFDVANYVWDNFAKSISVSAVAKQFNVSKSGLEKEFKKVHGVCVAEYIRNIRIYKVQTMIKDHPDRTVLDIAYSCGFNSSSGFYKAYKAVIGKSPKQ